MACRTLNLGDGVVGIACSRESRGKCSAPGCSSRAAKLCDYPVGKPGRKLKTCDAKLCARHAASVGTGRDYCPPHARIAAELGDPVQSEQGKLL